MRRIAGDWLTAAETQRVFAVLEAAGFRALAVGGCVRDALLERPVADIDIATNAPPERIIEIANSAGIESVPTGIDHGTVTLVVEGRPYEVTTFRRDVETFGRRAVVDFSDALEDDAERRDFTMNALYADRTGHVLDPLGEGLADLDARRVRFIHDADRRIREDFLRILRFFRFSAWYGDPGAGFDAPALEAIRENLAGLAGLSAERITHELLRLLAAPDPVPSLRAMDDTGVLAAILPGAELLGLDHLGSAEQAAGCGADPIRRLTALGPADTRGLRLSKRDARALERLRDEMKSDTNPAEIAYRHDAGTARSVAALRALKRGVPVPGDLADRIAAGTSARFPLRAADLMPGYEGPALGRKLAELEADWIASDFALTREELLARA